VSTARIVDLLNGDGCSLAYVCEQTGWKRPEAKRWLAEVGAVLTTSSQPRYRIPNLARNLKSWERWHHPARVEACAASRPIPINHKPCTGGAGK
jgi:hypothetical protein